MADQEQIQRQLRFLQIDQDTALTLRDLEELFESSIDDILHGFYSHILNEPELAALFADDESVERARSAQKRHWLKTLFAMKFGKAQFDQAERIARAHVSIGLVPSWYLAGYCFVLNHFIELLAKRYENDATGLSRVIQALNKAIFLDANLVIESYLEAKDSLMRGILLRATHFTDDVKDLNEDLINTTSDLRAKVESQLGSDSSADAYLEYSDRLSEQVRKLNSRLEQLQLGDKLYFHDVRKDKLLTRIKIFKKTHWRVPRLWK